MVEEVDPVTAELVEAEAAGIDFGLSTLGKQSSRLHLVEAAAARAAEVEIGEGVAAVEEGEPKDFGPGVRKHGIVAAE